MEIRQPYPAHDNAAPTMPRIAGTTTDLDQSIKSPTGPLSQFSPPTIDEPGPSLAWIFVIEIGNPRHLSANPCASYKPRQEAPGGAKMTYLFTFEHGA